MPGNYGWALFLAGQARHGLHILWFQMGHTFTLARIPPSRYVMALPLRAVMWLHPLPHTHTHCHCVPWPPEVIRIWDSLFADENRFSFLISFCAAMIMWVCLICADHASFVCSWIREQLLSADFSGCMKLLQVRRQSLIAYLPPSHHFLSGSIIQSQTLTKSSWMHKKLAKKQRKKINGKIDWIVF